MHPGQRVTDYDLCEVFSGAYQKVAMINKAIKGFKSSGIYPFNQETFCEEQYAPATVMEQPLQEFQMLQHGTTEHGTPVSVLKISLLPHVMVA